MINLVAASLTHEGLVRQENEDTVWAQVYTATNNEPVGLFVVCDGMGGHMGGRYASYWAVEAIKREFADLFVAKDPRATVVLSDEDIEAVRAGKLIAPQALELNLEATTQIAIQKANHVVYEFAKHKPDQAANAGTTTTMAVVRGDHVIIANVGDSRTYLLHNQELHQITKDHSLVASLIADGRVLPDEIYTHPQRNVIYRFLGQKGVVQPDIFHRTLKPGDHLLLCSDGFWEMVRSEHKILQMIINAPDVEQACQYLVDAAIAAGGEDNIGVIVVRVT
ncbi:MAG: serine/threonine-protein phosphatase [Anaerolineales bacterium]|nr:serine/threonine-protein phosphatase [Anaerolineales bacterium]